MFARENGIVKIAVIAQQTPQSIPATEITLNIRTAPAAKKHPSYLKFLLGFDDSEIPRKSHNNDEDDEEYIYTSEESCVSEIHNIYDGNVVTVGQTLIISLAIDYEDDGESEEEEQLFYLTITSITSSQQEDEDIINDELIKPIKRKRSEILENYFKISPQTKISIVNEYSPNIVIDHVPHKPTKKHGIEIGGLTEQLKEINRLFILPRKLLKSEFEKLNLKYLKGLLLYGPPGTGKTLLATKIASMLNTPNVKYISGPSILSMWLGDSEKNIRELFTKAKQDYDLHGQDAQTHIIVIDEIDALTQNRDNANSVMHGTITQLLSCMDGLDKFQNNIIIVGTTNRLSDIDPAFLRPGRFDVVLEIPAPKTLRDTSDILMVYLKKLIKNNKIDTNVKIDNLTEKMHQNKYTGAKIESIVKIATSFAIERSFLDETNQNVILNENDFKKAFEYADKHGNDNDYLKMYI
jgi:SpoVK/Ycf46/Vps4 family AAA+-type ATPase